jgi:hypothetical protein
MMIDDGEIETTNQAFASAIVPKSLGNIELEPFSLLRKHVAFRLGTGKEGNVYYDSVIIAWLMSRPANEVARVARNEDSKDQAIIDAFAWVEANGLDKDQSRGLAELIKRINLELDRSTAVEPQNGDQESKNDGGPPTI